MIFIYGGWWKIKNLYNKFKKTNLKWNVNNDTKWCILIIMKIKNLMKKVDWGGI